MKNETNAREFAGRQALEEENYLMAEGIRKMFGEFLIVDLVTGKYRIYKTDEMVETVGQLKQDDFKKFNLEYGQRLIFPADRQNFFDMFTVESMREAVRRGREEFSAEFRRKEPDGSYRWCELIGNLLKRTPEECLVLLTFRDTHEGRQKLQEALEEAHRANRAKTEFLSRMSHDIRTPLNAILGMASIASMYAGDAEKVLECMNKIDLSSRYLLTLINEILDVARIESGKAEIREEPFILCDFMEDIAMVAHRSMEEKGHEFILSGENIVDEALLGDYGHLQRILLNLLSNAAKYTPRNGHIRLHVIQEPSEVPGCRKHVFSVEDDGVGMDREFLHKIFEPYERSGGITSKEIEGSGLGMAIVRNLVDLLNGEISIESQPGRGTKCLVEVHLKIQKAREVQRQALYGKRALVVDSDERAGGKAAEILNSLGMACDCVTNTCDAMEAGKAADEERRGYDFVTASMDMEGENGLEFIGRLRREPWGKKPSAVLLANVWNRILERARDCGVDILLSSPLNAQKAVHLFSRALLMKEGNSIPKQESNLKGLRILLVEDNEINREIAGEFLRRAQAEADMACNGQEAVEKLRESEDGVYAAVLMDIQMPVMNGYEAARAIRNLKEPKKAEVPIIAMTANAFREDIEKALMCGMNGHIAKPVDYHLLVQTVLECIGKNAG